MPVLMLLLQAQVGSVTDEVFLLGGVGDTNCILVSEIAMIALTFHSIGCREELVLVDQDIVVDTDASSSSYVRGRYSAG